MKTAKIIASEGYFECHDKINLQDWQRQNKSLWIVKPPAKARGNGIKVISKWNQIPKTRPILVQRYSNRLLYYEQIDCEGTYPSHT